MYNYDPSLIFPKHRGIPPQERARNSRCPAVSPSKGWVQRLASSNVSLGRGNEREIPWKRSLILTYFNSLPPMASKTGGCRMCTRCAHKKKKTICLVENVRICFHKPKPAWSETTKFSQIKITKEIFVSKFNTGRTSGASVSKKKRNVRFDVRRRFVSLQFVLATETWPCYIIVSYIFKCSLRDYTAVLCFLSLFSSEDQAVVIFIVFPFSPSFVALINLKVPIG